MSKRSSEHATFVIERTYDASPARVFAAWADLDAKRRWFGPPQGGVEHDLDFRVGGREHFVVDAGEAVYSFDALYEDIVPDERIVYTYNMHVGDAMMSVSVSAVEFVASDAGTQLRYTELGVYLDGTDTPQAREHGTGELLDKLGAALGQGATV
ncbi:MAG TPA: SRPBCC family protein [Solirubrobacteraceae bacterium]|nr:SRPBCC family protein [Solirubrobacteraceae bacterium]